MVSNNGYYYTHWLLRPFNKQINYIVNFYLLDKVIRYCDYLGLNHYCSASDVANIFVTRRSDLGWPINPQAFYDTIMLLSKRYKNKPIYITENGIADAKDIKRKSFIHDNLVMVHKAIEDGADVRGYLHWSLIDNYEWRFGFKPRFGLVEVNYKTQKRTPRPSAYYYKEICESNSIEI
jgi:beta-glucosidase/6-phospho-beta-glucosidase/beta-galactosidase